MTVFFLPSRANLNYVAEGRGTAFNASLTRRKKNNTRKARIELTLKFTHTRDKSVVTALK